MTPHSSAVTSAGKIMPFDEKRDREISYAKKKAHPESILREIDKQLSRFGLGVIQLETGENASVWKITHRP
jgi:hypothetical protein